MTDTDQRLCAPTLLLPSPLSAQRLVQLPDIEGARIKERTGDFLVEELQLYDPCGEGEHLYLRIVKEGMTHHEMVDMLCKHFDVGTEAIGTAGMKDRVAVTHQTVSIHLPVDRPVGELRHERREYRGEQRGDDPVRRAADRLAGGPVGVREDLRDEDPDHGPLADGMGGDEGEDAGRHDRKIAGRKCPRTQPQRNDVAQRSDHQQRPPAEPIDEPQAHEREHEVRDADADRLQKRRLLAHAGQFEDPRREVEDRVDSRELIEERDQECQDQRPPKARRCRGGRALRRLGSRHDASGRGVEFLRRGVGRHAQQHRAGLLPRCL